MAAAFFKTPLGSLIMGHIDLVRTLQTLPAEKQEEVMYFVQFLATKFAVPAPVTQGDWTETAFSQLAIQQAMRGIDDEAAIYVAADLKERWQ
jgi:hypothetical protein